VQFPQRSFLLLATLIRLYEFLKNSRAPCDACQSININQHQNRLNTSNFGFE
jgi:hypothetical protein